MYDGAKSCLLKLPENRRQQENRVDLILVMVWQLHLKLKATIIHLQWNRIKVLQRVLVE